MRYILLITLLSLGGCITPEQMYSQNVNACESTARSYNLQGPYYEQFMRQCPGIQGGGYSSAYQGFSRSTNPVGQADQFGPYGYRGPTWEQFNNQFNQPQQVILPPVR